MKRTSWIPTVLFAVAAVCLLGAAVIGGSWLNGLAGLLFLAAAVITGRSVRKQRRG